VPIATLVCCANNGSAQGLSITNYHLVSQQTVRGAVNLTYRADLVNTGSAIEAAAATVTSLNAASQVTPGQNILDFGPVPANSQVTSSNTFTLQLYNGAAVDFSQLQWSFRTAALLVPADV